MSESADDIVTLIQQAGQGNSEAFDAIVRLTYDDMKAYARFHQAGESPDHTMQPTALLNEAFMRLTQSKISQVKDRNHLQSLLSRIMRNILVDHARRKRAVKRGGNSKPINDLDSIALDPHFNIDILGLDQALNSLAQKMPRLEQVVECKFFGDMTTAETADALGIGVSTVEREWMRARAYLAEQLGGRTIEAYASGA